jgi:type VI secretion system protein ImpL
MLTSKRFVAEKRWKEVEGPYTEKGHYRVLRNVKEGVGLLEREQWVVPLTNEEKGERVPLNLKHLAEEYDQRYAEQWTDFLLDLEVKTPATVKEAIELYQVLGRPEWPYLRILRTLEDNTQWKDKNKEVFENEEIQREAKRRINEKLSTATRGLRFDIDLKKIGDRTSTVPSIFKRTTEFAIPPPGGSSDTPLAKYVSKLEAVGKELQKEEDTRGPNVDPRLVADRLDDAGKAAADLLQPFDDKARTLLSPLLTNPLKIVTARLPPGGASKVAVPGGTRWAPPTPPNNRRR